MGVATPYSWLSRVYVSMFLFLFTVSSLFDPFGSGKRAAPRAPRSLAGLEPWSPARRGKREIYFPAARPARGLVDALDHESTKHSDRPQSLKKEC